MNTPTTSDFYPGPVPNPLEIGTDDQRLVVVHFDPERYDGTTALELHCFLSVPRRNAKPALEARGKYPLRWLQGYPEDHPAGVCDECTQAHNV